MHSIAFRYGFFPESLWLHPDNADLRQLRDADNVLLKGDVVVIPDLELRTESGATDAEHVFVRHGVPAMLRMVFTRRVVIEDEGTAPAASASDESVYEDVSRVAEVEYEPIANAPYVISRGVTAEGTSDADGMVEVPIPPDAAQARIVFHGGTEDEIEFEIALGHLDPIDTVRGVGQRLANMGYNCVAESAMNDSIRDALMRFQAEYGLTASGEPDQATKDRLGTEHGS